MPGQTLQRGQRGPCSNCESDSDGRRSKNSLNMLRDLPVSTARKARSACVTFNGWPLALDPVAHRSVLLAPRQHAF